MSVHVLRVDKELIHVPLPLDLLENAFVVIIAKGATEFVVCHGWLALDCSPPNGNRLRLQHSEFFRSSV